jgi:signal transduction histidine kinase
VISVTDDGVGMPNGPDAPPPEPGRRPRNAGAGLGLSIARGIVTAHGGRIDLEQRHPGTCFRIHLPIEAAHGAGSDV